MATIWAKEGQAYAELYFRPDEDLMLFMDWATAVKGNDGCFHLYCTVAKAPGIKVSIDGSKSLKALKPGQPIHCKIPYGEYDKYDRESEGYKKAQPTVVDLAICAQIESNGLADAVFKGVFLFDPSEIAGGESHSSGFENLEVLATTLEEGKKLEGFNLPELPALKGGKSSGGGGKGNYAKPEGTKLDERLTWLLAQLKKSADPEIAKIDSLESFVDVLSDSDSVIYAKVAMIWEVYQVLQK
jgi:hypothetical protein